MKIYENPREAVQYFQSITNRRDASEFWALQISHRLPSMFRDGVMAGPSPFENEKDQTYVGAALVARAAQQHGAANVFRLGDGLAEQLALTDIEAVDGSDLRLPFDGFWLRLPNHSEINTRGRPVVMIGVTEVAAEYDGEGGSPKVVPADHPNARRSLLLVVMSDALPDHIPSHARLLFDITPGPLTFLRNPSDGLVVNGIDQGTQGIRRLAVNALLYITSPNPDVKPASGARADTAWDEAVTAARTSPRAPGRHRPGARMLWNVGESVKRLRVASLDVLVRGHWRRQTHGPRHSLRKMIWIQPHVRMPTGAPTAGHDYVVDEAS